MKVFYAFRSFAFVTLLVWGLTAKAQTQSYTTTATGSWNWNTVANWQKNGSAATTWPGQIAENFTVTINSTSGGVQLNQVFNASSSCKGITVVNAACTLSVWASNTIDGDLNVAGVLESDANRTITLSGDLTARVNHTTDNNNPIAYVLNGTKTNGNYQVIKVRRGSTIGAITINSGTAARIDSSCNIRGTNGIACNSNITPQLLAPDRVTLTFRSSAMPAGGSSIRGTGTGAVEINRIQQFSTGGNPSGYIISRSIKCDSINIGGNGTNCIVIDTTGSQAGNITIETNFIANTGTASGQGIYVRTGEYTTRFNHNFTLKVNNDINLGGALITLFQAGSGANAGFNIRGNLELSNSAAASYSTNTTNASTVNNFIVSGSGSLDFTNFGALTVRGNITNTIGGPAITLPRRVTMSGEWGSSSPSTIGVVGGGAITFNSLTISNASNTRNETTLTGVSLNQDISINGTFTGANNATNRALGFNNFNVRLATNGYKVIFNATSANTSSLVCATGNTIQSDAKVFRKFMNLGSSGWPILEVSNTSTALQSASSFHFEEVNVISGGFTKSAGTDTIDNQIQVASTFSVSSGQTLRYGNNCLVRTLSGGSYSIAGTVGVVASATIRLHYNTGATFTLGSEWPNTAGVVSELMVGPTSGAGNGSSLTLGTIGSRNVTTRVYINSTGTAITGALPLVSNATIERASGTFSVAPTFGANTNVTYLGNLTTGVELPTSGLQSLIINPGASNTVTLNANATPASALNIQSGTLSTSTFTFNGGGSATLTVSGTGTLQIGGTSGFPTGYSTVTLNSGSTVEYNSTSAQTIGARNYQNLTINGSRGVNNITLASGTIDVAGTFTVGASFSSGTWVNAGNTFNYSGAAGQVIRGINYNNLSSASADRTLNGTIRIAGTFTPGSGTYTSASSTVDYNGTGAQTIAAINYNNLTVSGSRGTNNITLANSGTVSIAGAFTNSASFSSGAYVTAGSTVAMTGSGQSVPSLGTRYNNLTINQSSGNASLGASLGLNGTLTLSAGKLNLGSNTLTLGSAAIISVSSPSGTKMIDKGTGSLIKEYASPSSESITLPIGTGSDYTPATISNLTATGTGSITVNLYATGHPDLAAPSVALSRYWSFTVTGLTISSADLSLTYVAGDVNGTEGSYVIRRRSGGSWVDPGGSLSSPTITISGVNAGLNGDFTAGELSAFAAVTIYYSLGGDWNTAASWSLAGFGGAAASSVPTSSDQVRVGDNKTIIVTTNNIQATSLQIQATGILQFDDVTTGHSVGAVSGTGRMLFNNSTSSTPLINIGTLTDFVSSSGGTVEYGGTGAYTLPTQATYNNLVISGTGAKTSGANSTLNTGLTIASGATFTVAHNVTNEGSTFSVAGTYNQTSGSTSMSSDGTANLTGAGAITFNNLVIDGTTSFAPSVSFNVNGNFTNSSTAGSSFGPSAGTVTFGGSSLQTIGGAGSGTVTFRNITIGAGASVTTANSFDILGNITNSSNGISGNSFDATGGTITFSGNTTQNLSGSGTGVFNFNNLTISGSSTFAPSVNFSLDGTLTNSSSATNTISASAGTLTIATASGNFTGSGTGALNLIGLTIASGARLNSGVTFNIAGDLTNNSNGSSAISLNHTAGTLSFNGSSLQNLGGTGSGSLNLNNLTIAAGASVNCSQSLNISGNITNSSSGISLSSFNQTAGTTTINGASAQSLTGTGTGFFAVNNLTIANTPSRLNASTRLIINGDFTVSSNGISSIAYSQTADTTVFGNGVSAQTLSGSGTGTVEFFNLKIGHSNNARLNTSRNFNLAANIRIVSNGQGSPGLALNNTSNTVTLTGTAAQTLIGTGTGILQFNNIAFNNSSSFTPQLSVSIAGNMEVNTTTSPFWDALASTTLTFNGTSTQNIQGSAGSARTCSTGILVINAGAGVQVAANRPFVLSGSFTNNSNGIGGNAFLQSATSSGLTFTGSNTYSFTSPGTGLVTLGNLTVASGARVNCDFSFTIRSAGTLTFSSNGQSGVQFQQTAGTTTVLIGGGSNTLGGTGTGSVTFFNLSFGNGAPGTTSLDRNFTVSESMTFATTNTNQTVQFGTGGNYTVTVKDLVLNSGSFTVSVANNTSRTHTLNISGNISGSGTSANMFWNTTAINNVNGSGQVNVVFTGASQSISGSAPKNLINVNLANSTITNTSQGLIIGSYRGAPYFTPAFARSGTGTWNQSGTGAVSFRTQSSNITVPASAFITTTTDTTRFIDTAGAVTLPYTSFGHLKLVHIGGTTTYNLGGTTSCRDLVLSGGTLNIGANTLNIAGTITTSGSGAFDGGTGTANFNGSLSQNIGAFTFNNLTLSGAGTKSLTGNVTVNANFTGNAPLVLGSTARTLTITGNVSGSSSIDVSSAAHTLNLNGATNSLTGGILATSNTATVTYGRSGDQTMIAGNYRNLTVSGSGTKTIGGTTSVNNDLTVSAGTLELGSTARLLTISGSLTGTGTFNSSGNSNHHVVLSGATNDITTLTQGNAKYTYNRAGAQTVVAGTYRALVIGGSGTKTLGSAATASDSLMLNAGTLDNTAGLTFGNGMVLVDNGGTLSVAPTFGTTVNLRYTAAGTLGFEVPTSSGIIQNLLIDPGAGNVVSLGTFSPDVNGTLTLTSGILSLGTNTLTINGTLTGSGVIRGNASGNIVIGGTSGGSVGNLSFESGNTTINNLTINRNGGTADIGMASNMNVNGTLTFNGTSTCHLNTGAFTLGLGTTGALAGEDNDSYVRGTLTASRTTNNVSNQSFGNTGFTIVQCNNCNMGTVNYTRTSGPGAAITGETGNSGISRVWSISPTTQPANEVTIQFSWLSADDNGITGTTARVWKKQGASPYAKTIWSFPFADRNIVLGTTSFSDWTIGDDDLPLPVNLFSMDARMEMGRPIVSWSTLSETNSEKFVLERSKDGKTFSSIAELTAAGNSNIRRDYSYADAEMMGGEWEVLFYRLRQYDRNGNFIQYDPIRLFRTGVPGKVSAAPIPFNNDLTLGFVSGSQGTAKIRITDVVGKLVSSFEKEYGLGTNSLNLNQLANLKAGVYQVAVDADGYSMTLKLVKE